MGSVIDNSVEKKVVSDAASSMAMHEMFVSEITENASASKMWVYTYKLILYGHVFFEWLKKSLKKIFLLIKSLTLHVCSQYFIGGLLLV